MNKLVIISGYFNPLHAGHLDYIEAAKSLGDKLWIIINSDNQVKIKGSVPFQNEYDRLRIVRCLKPVDNAILSIDKDATVINTLRNIHAVFSQAGHDIIFANGGDRLKGNTPEEIFCRENGVQTIYGIGGEKVQSSSSLIDNISNKG